MGVIRGYPLDRVYEEVAFVAYHFHWDHDDILEMPHWERRRWCAEISRINERTNATRTDEGGATVRSLDEIR